MTSIRDWGMKPAAEPWKALINRSAMLAFVNPECAGVRRESVVCQRYACC